MFTYTLRVRNAVILSTIIATATPSTTQPQPVPDWNAGGVVDVNDSIAVIDNIVLNTPLTLNVDSHKNIDLQGGVSLANGLVPTAITKTGAGGLRLSGNNALIGKNHYLQQGSITVANSNALGNSLSRLVASRGTLIEYADGVAISNRIVVTDDHYALNPADLVNNSNLNADAVTWHVADGNSATQLANIELNANTPLIKTGGGELILDASAIIPNGLFEVHNGSVQVNRDFTGFIILKNDAVLSSNRAIDNLNLRNNSAVAPTDKLTINNNINFGNNTTLKVRTWANGNSDSIHSMQTANLAGNVLAIPQGIASDWSANGYSFVILQADDNANINPNGGLNNTRFNSVESAVPYLKPSLSYTPNQVILNLKPIKINRNGSLNNHTNNHSWIANTRAVLLDDSRFIRQFALQPKPNNTKLWMKALYSNAEIGLKTNNYHKGLGLNVTESIDRQIGGLFLGINLFDREKYDSVNRQNKTHNETNATVNLIAGYTNSHLRGYSTLADPKSDINSYHLAITGGYKNNGLKIKYGVSHSHHKIRYRRLSTALTSNQNNAWGHNVNSSSKATTNQVFLKTSYRLNDYVRPYVGVAHIRYADKGFKESGGALAVNTKRLQAKQTIASLGLDIKMPVNDSASVNVGLAYSRTFGKINPCSNQYYRYDALKTTMTAKPTAQRRNNFDFKIGVDGRLSDIGGGKPFSAGALKNTWLGIEYSGRYAKRSSEHGVRVGVKAVF